MLGIALSGIGKVSRYLHVEDDMAGNKLIWLPVLGHLTLNLPGVNLAQIGGRREPGYFVSSFRR